MAFVGGNNSGNIVGRDQYINQIYPCKWCSSLLRKEDYEKFPYCNPCIVLKRQNLRKNIINIFTFIGIIVSFYYIFLSSTLQLHIKEIIYQYITYYGISNKIKDLLTVILPAAIMMCTSVVIGMVLAYCLNKKRYPLHR